ncbi:methionine ABC transporter ATP-binding protein [Paenibacillus sp. URB8-2]|uniref:methionine ABC transporter ATP-binding protein n=1 Tax=Paenibacillus sp. URB8-2 TaxID=2741301 RepID=UPI0015BE788C|nr:ATP-binding cassette domain-containing protein [Paenibacillus sp. URB8-2]BCG59108.1 methionine import ATP-binding protein MetN 2 [Paenibacillus sp. URB8-2]
MIRFENISVKYTLKSKQEVEAVRGVTLEIGEGEIFGIVGTSGAGKSTLLRTINLLQRPTDGRILIGGNDITHLKGEALRQLRLKTGMIFQHFNLIHNKTVFDNIAFAMRSAGKSKSEIERRVPEVLELVGLLDKAKSYPSNLSGGQKQRVGIARSIANDPQILLCDEPTSALDMETTQSILDLLKEINNRLKITTVIISHEMDVIKKICDKVAVMSKGEVVETGDVFRIFAVPEHPFTKQLVNSTLDLELPRKLNENRTKRLFKLVYRGERAEEPVISETVRKFPVDMNILHGKIEYIAEQPIGVLILNLEGAKESVDSAVSYLRTRVAEVEELHA